MKTNIYTKLSFAEKLEDQLKELRMSKSELANALNVNKTTVSNWCSGIRKPNIDMVIRICQVTNLDFFYLVGATIPDGELRPSELELLTCYRNVNGKGKKGILDMAKLLNDMEHGK